MRKLFDALARFHVQLEYDFRVYGGGLDLLDFWRGRMSFRLAWVMIQNFLVRPETAFCRAFNPDDARWGQTDHLVATLIDTVHLATGSDYRVPRPGSPEEKAALEKADRIASQRARGRAAFDARQRQQREGRAG